MSTLTLPCFCQTININPRPLKSSSAWTTHPQGPTYCLELELTNHPNCNFVFNLLSTLKEGACIGYSRPCSDQVSPNLISAVQHPDVVSLNLPLFQCHPVGVVPKKHSTDWCTIYHLSYPQGDCINNYIPKDPYSLSYVRVNNAIHILQSLGRGAFMAKDGLEFFTQISKVQY